MDTSYIQENVASVLAEGLRETINAKPVDPIDYLAKWLLHYRDVQDNVSQFNSDQVELQVKKQEYMETLQKEKEQMDEAEKLRKEEEKRIASEKRKKDEEKRKKREIEEEESTEPEENQTPSAEANSESIYSSSYSNS